jgi:hypothetical protein
MPRGLRSGGGAGQPRVKRHQLRLQTARQPKIAHVIGAETRMLRQFNGLGNLHIVLRDIAAGEKMVAPSGSISIKYNTKPPFRRRASANVFFLPSMRTRTSSRFHLSPAEAPAGHREEVVNLSLCVS